MNSTGTAGGRLEKRFLLSAGGTDGIDGVGVNGENIRRNRSGEGGLGENN